MIVFPNCKINLGLNIIRKRADGYHDIETVFYPIPLKDALEVVENKNAGPRFSLPFTSSGVAIDSEPSSNLCVKAYRLLKKDFPHLPPVKMHLHKVIPAGAGLGGGSSDGAFTLKLLNDLFNLELDQKQLSSYAAQLGSDCPFFIIDKPCYATGRGEILEPFELDLGKYMFVIIYPGIHINTGRAFLDIRPGKPEKSMKEIIKNPIERWQDELCNDFEKIIFPKNPAIVEIKDELYRLGAIYASMSGSGSTVYGIFEKDKKIELSFPADYFVKKLD